VVARPLHVRRESLLRTPRPASPIAALCEDNSPVSSHQASPNAGARLSVASLNRVWESRSYRVPMFTGIVRERGRVVSFDGSRLVVAASCEVGVGDSVSIAGVCLTVVACGEGVVSFDVVGETLERSTLGSLVEGAEVNVEPALRAGDVLGGHIVQGHVDGVGRMRGEADGLTWFDAPPPVARYCVEKGSVTVDGTSLTVAGLDDRGFAVALVPHTLEVTTLGALRPGDPVNLETDVIAKYVERLTMDR
jgi:riboflavin synthase